MNHLINPLALGKVLKKYNLTPQNKQPVVLMSKRKPQHGHPYIDLQENRI